jgi:energy-coupling factor transport system substrate-specific component
VNWQVATFVLLVAVLVVGFAWYERSRPTARLIALVAALAALAVAGRLIFAPIPNVVATTDIVLITGFALGAAPGFAVGALAAPISNIWLGQGPWTAWQMAGWGLVGLGGALFAVLTRRRVNRLGLASVCALAGFAYGALLDYSTMVTYGGEQSLDRYLELSARGLPFNVVHAAGNFAIALAAGPALVRMVSRFRTRLEFNWPVAEVAPVLLVAIIGAGVLGLVRPQPAAASPSAISWLRDAQSDDGGYAATTGQSSSPAMTGWAMLGLEAAGVNPLDVRTRGETPVSYLRAEVDRLRSVGDLERSILALEGAGVDPHDFAGENLVANLRRKRDGDGSVDGQVNLTAFYALAMRAAGADSGSLKRSAAWLRSAQNGDGGWGIAPKAPSESDSTGAALQGLIAAGARGKSASEGARWLRRAQQRGGAWALGSSGVLNTQSTAWAVQGLVAAGSGSDEIEAGEGYLAKLQAADGHYRYSVSSDQTPIWVTAQVLLATKRKPFPLAQVPRKATPERPAHSRDSSGGGGGGKHAAGASNGASPGSNGGGASAHSSGGGNHHAASDDAGNPAMRDPQNDDTPTSSAANEEVTGATTTPMLPGEESLEAPAPQADDDDDSTVIWLIVGFTALAAALVGGFLWYRRTLP